MKTPKILTTLRAVMTRKPAKKLHASARVARPTMEDYESDEPTTKLSSAFIVVLILHVVAVGGIYAFNSIKASRRGQEAANRPVEAAVPAAAPAAGKAAAAQSQPVAAAAATSSAALTARKVEPVASVPAAASVKPTTGRQHDVKAGENLTKIAFAYNVSAADIMTANQLKEGAILRPGQSLVIPAAKTAAKPAADTVKVTATPAKQADVPPTKTTPGMYTVKKGDTLTSIAKSFGLTLEDLSKANKITDPKKLQLGQVLKVPPRKS